jgi:hypothetical protein
MRCALTDEQVVRLVVAEVDIPALDHSSKAVKIAPSPFEIWAAREGYDTAPAVVPCPLRQFADRETQKAFEVYQGGAANTARMVMESTLETEALREKLVSIAVSE